MVRQCCISCSYLQFYYLSKRQIDRNGMLKTIQFDIKNKRVFLKKCEYPNLQLKDVFVGAVLNVYSRQLKIIDFADEFTRSKF